MSFRDRFSSLSRANPDQVVQENIANLNQIEFTARLKELLLVEDQVYSEYFINQDHLVNKISPADRKEIHEIGFTEAYQLGKKVSRENQDMDTFTALLDSLEVDYEFVKDDRKNLMLYFGSYDTDGPIRLYQGNLKPSKQIIKSFGLNEIISNEELDNIILAHELYHYLEDEIDDLYSNQKRIDLWSFGSYTHTSGLICTEEIGAMAFAKGLLGLPYNPTAINYLLFSSFNKQSGEDFYQSVRQLKADRQI